METTPSQVRPASAILQRAEALLAKLPANAAAVARAHAMAHIVRTLDAEDDVILGALLYPLLESSAIGDAVADQFGQDAAHIARESIRIGGFDSVALSSAEQSISSSQAESLRKMLLAIAIDPRLVLVRLADQLYRMREAKSLDELERRRLAMQTRDIYAPLANRLGIWQIKWELEDLSFRYLEPESYKRVASLLASKRVDRERYIEDVKQQLKAALEHAGIQAEIAGRPKHIFSIWRKMQRKHLSFDQLYDVRAVRVLVDNIADCYAALGIVHGMWAFIPGEFDDYIATPKDNLYRSLHTAVIGPEKLPLEVQIRTREMHEHAELGVAAHWTYKEGGRANAAYQQKINWLRQLIEPAASGESAAEADSDFLDRMRAEVFEDRVYALSPRGEVIELPQGATPLDYAYHVHTNLGHRCRGAKVNGRMVQLDHKLSNGDQVEIIASKQLNPSRDWLVPTLGFLASQRNRNKVRAWFRKQDEVQNRAQGKQLLERELQRLAIHSITLAELVDEFKLNDADALYLALGEGELTLSQITHAIQRKVKAKEWTEASVEDEIELITRKPQVKAGSSASINVDGVDDLLSHYAKCCRPVPPEPITGYITLGRGISIHRRNCASVNRLLRLNPERIIEVNWGKDGDRTFNAAIFVQAYDRRGLVRDVSAVLSDLHINIQNMNSVTHSRDGIVDMTIGIVVHDLAELSTAIGRIQSLQNIVSVRRKS